MNTAELKNVFSRELRFAKLGYEQGDRTMTHRDFRIMTKHTCMIEDSQGRYWKPIHHFDTGSADVIFLAEIFDVDGECNIDEPTSARCRMIWVHEEGFSRKTLEESLDESSRLVFCDEIGDYKDLSWKFMFQAGIDEGIEDSEE